MSRLIVCPVLVAVAVVLTGCSFCTGSGCTTSATDLARDVQTQFAKFAKSRGLPPLPPVTCPNAIRNEVGAKAICYAKGDLGGGHMGVLPIHVRVDGVNGSTVNLDLRTGQVQPLH